MSLLSSGRSRYITAAHHSLWRYLFGALLLFALPVFIWAVLTQRIELRKRAATAEPPIVCWNRVIGQATGNTSTLNWPNGCRGNPDTTRVCTQALVPLTATETYQFNRWVNAGRPSIPGCTRPTPTPVSRYINWQTPYASLKADGIRIIANGRTFFADNNFNAVIHSNPGSGNNVTLESTWYDRGTEMRLNIYFLKACTRSIPAICNWNVSEIRTYGGNSPGNWITYRGGTGPITQLRAPVGQAFTAPTFQLSSSDGGTGEILFTNFRIQGFLNEPTITPKPTTPPGCYYKQVQCVQAPCNPILTCPSPSPTCIPMPVCATQGEIGPNGQRVFCSIPPPPNGSSYCPRPTCIPLPRCATEGTRDANGRLVYCAVDPMPGTNYCPRPTPTPTCMPRPACLDAAQPCAIRLMAGTWFCPKTTPTPTKSSTPTPTCMPRPACLDPLPGQPICALTVLPGTWFCPKTTPTPTKTPTPTRRSTLTKTPTPTPAVCGGIVGIVCPSGLTCRYSGGSTRPPYPDAMGVCVSPAGGRFSPTPTQNKSQGDLNNDGKVDIFDYNILLTNFGKTGSPGFIPADIIKNGKVDIFDYNILVSYFK